MYININQSVKYIRVVSPNLDQELVTEIERHAKKIDFLSCRPFWMEFFLIYCMLSPIQ